MPPRVRPQLPITLPCRIALIGETPGEVEVIKGEPFKGPSGSQLNGWLREAGIARTACYIDNVLSFWPKPDLDSCFVPTKKFLSLVEDADRESLEYRVAFHPCRKGQHLHPEHWPELTRLFRGLEAYRPNVIVALGALALWALTGRLGIQSYAGHVLDSHIGIKVIPCLHPAFVLRQYSQRPHCIRAMKRAAEECNSPARIVPEERKVKLVESLTEALFALSVLHESGALLSIDIETAPAAGAIRSISIGMSETESYCFVFCQTDWGAGNFWENPDDEIALVLALRTVLESSQPKLFHRGQYDIAFLWLAWGVRTHNHAEDTLLKHHAYSPEQGKKLSELGVRYCQDLGPWKARWAQREEARDK